MAPLSTLPEPDPGLGKYLYALVERLYPLCRSITGDGLRETLAIVSEYVPLTLREIPTGTRAFDWTVPKEWNVRDAYVKDSADRRVVDFKKNNLHLVSYSVPVRKTLSLDELKAHLHCLPEQPGWIPYRTAYYSEDWGFCLSHDAMQTLEPGTYEVLIDSRLEEGSLTYGEYLLPGRSKDEVILFAHACHPSLCNDNLSGIALLVYLARHLTLGQRLRYSYRFVFAPATIGSVVWLSQNSLGLHKIKHGLVASVVGDPGHLRYKRSRRGDAEIDRAVLQALKDSGKEYEVLEFSPWGYDERQFCSPGIDLPVGRLTRSPNGAYAEYHTSADNLDFVRPEYLADSLHIYTDVLRILENNCYFLNTSPKGEPQLGRRGLYRKMGGQQDIEEHQLALLWVLNLSDGKHSLLDIAERSGLSFKRLCRAVEDLLQCRLLTLAF